MKRVKIHQTIFLTLTLEGSLFVSSAVTPHPHSNGTLLGIICVFHRTTEGLRCPIRSHGSGFFLVWFDVPLTNPLLCRVSQFLHASSQVSGASDLKGH